MARKVFAMNATTTRNAQMDVGADTITRIADTVKKTRMESCKNANAGVSGQESQENTRYSLRGQ